MFRFGSMIYYIQHMHEKRLGNTFVELGQFLHIQIYNGILVVLTSRFVFLWSQGSSSQGNPSHWRHSLECRLISYYATALLSKNRLHGEAIAVLQDSWGFAMMWCLSSTRCQVTPIIANELQSFSVCTGIHKLILLNGHVLIYFQLVLWFTWNRSSVAMLKVDLYFNHCGFSLKKSWNGTAGMKYVLLSKNDMLHIYIYMYEYIYIGILLNGPCVIIVYSL